MYITNRKKCKKAPQQVLKGKLQKYAAAAAAGSNSHTWDYLSAEHNSSEATSLNSSTIDSHGLIEERRIATRDRAGMVMSYYLTPEQQHMHRHQLDNSSLGAHVTKQQHQHIHQHQHNCKETCVTGAERGGLVSIEGREKGKVNTFGMSSIVMPSAIAASGKRNNLYGGLLTRTPHHLLTVTLSQTHAVQ